MSSTARYLTDEQVRIANAITSVLEMERADKLDAFKAMISIMAATINDSAGTEMDARIIAAGLATELKTVVEKGRAGLYEARP
jgi:hypothetical protein